MVPLKFLLTFAIVLQFSWVKPNPISRSDGIATEFIILHNNDMHARFEQTSKDGSQCTEPEALSNKCYGGFARVAYEVRKYRKEAENGGVPVFFLNAGDTYTGTAWFTIFKDNITAAFLNILQPDAISLGNHEFDEGVDGLVPFLNAAEFPVLASNLDLTKAKEIAATKSFALSTILETPDKTKVGVIGYLTPDTKILSVSSEVELTPEIEAINAEAAKLKAQGVKIIIALGHSGYKKDQEIALNCKDVDIVIGGHSHSGNPPNSERPEGPYPTAVKQNSGKIVPVVQAYAYTKYLGKLHVQFDKDGNLIKFDGTPILLDSEVPAEDDVLQLLEVYRPNITALEKSVVGYTKVYLEGSSSICRKEECNLGNLISDSMIYARVVEDLGGSFWTDASIAFLQGGGIRSSINKRSDGSITEGDIFTVLPFKNDIYVMAVTGINIRESLEHAASLRNTDSNGGFMQMSGVHVTYDFNKDDGSKVTSVDVRCAECEVPMYSPLDDKQIYNILLTKYIIDGGDGYKFVNVSLPQRLQKNDKEALIQYLKVKEIVYPEVEGRITVIDKPEDNGASGLSGSLSISIVLMFLIKLLNGRI